MTTYRPHRRGHTDLSALAAEEPPLSRAALAGLVLALLAGLMVLLAGPGSRWGWWHFRTGFTLLKWGAYLGVLAALVSAAALFLAWRGRGKLLAGVGLVVALAAFLVPWSARNGARGLPSIHDITTDTRNPPAFVTVAPLRADAPNPVAYPGDSVAAQQQKAYPDLKPLFLALPRHQAFQEAEIAARAMGWEIVEADREEGRIEATDQTFWFGFKDDVVIRVTSEGGVSRVDVRSKSRVGRGDAGANAERIRDYLERLRNRVSAAVVE
jgi:uncharacterized protein (DUF1499 family)